MSALPRDSSHTLSDGERSARAPASHRPVFSRSPRSCSSVVLLSCAAGGWFLFLMTASHTRGRPFTHAPAHDTGP